MGDKDSKTLDLKEHILQTVKHKHPETVQRLVELVRQQHPLPQQEIMTHILDLQNQGKLALKENAASIPLTLKGYLASPHSYWYWTIVALAIATTAAVFTIQENAYPIVYARYLLGSIFVLLLPGYSFVKALFPTKEIDSIERAALSVGMSLALVPITGLLLNYTPWGLRITPVTLSLLALTTVFATAAILREHEAASIQ